MVASVNLRSLFRANFFYPKTNITKVKKTYQTNNTPKKIFIYLFL